MVHKPNDHIEFITDSLKRVSSIIKIERKRHDHLYI